MSDNRFDLPFDELYDGDGDIAIPVSIDDVLADLDTDVPSPLDDESSTTSG